MISFTDSRFIIGKEEFAPYAAEMHYFRIPKRYWSICFERIRRAGFRIISTVVPWNLHEDDNREFDFSGFTDPSKDLIVFVELVREFGFKLILRPGPWLFSEYNGNGLPRFLEKYPEIFARDKDGKLVRSVNRADVPACYVPSIGHPRYLNFIRHYLNGLTEIVKNYVYPRGPLFMLELDSENYFGKHLEPHLTDYNEHVVKEVYPRWLDEKYQEIKHLNKAYSSRYKSFGEVEPPMEFVDVPPKDMAIVYDWFRFKEFLLDDFQTELREMYKTFSCEPMFIKTLSFSNNFQSPVTSSRAPSESGFLGASLSWDISTGENLERVRHLRTVSAFPYLSELPVGNWSYSPERSKEYYPIGADATRYMVTVALAGGVKGMTYHMLAGRDYWYGAALASDGTIQESYELIKTLNISAQENEIYSFEPVGEIGLVTYRPYTWESILEENGKQKSPTHHLMSTTMPGIGRDLDMLKFDYGVPDLSVPASVEKFKTLIIPISDVMDENEQKFIVELARKGHNIVLIGVLPQFDTARQSCTILASALRCKMTSDLSLGQVTGEGQEFTSMLFGTLRTTEKRKRILAKVSQKVVALSYSKFKGDVILISFDPSSESNHHKMIFLESILLSFKIRRYVETSNPRIRAIVHRRENDVLLLLLNSNPSLQFKDETPAPTKTAVRLDLKALGLKSARIRMTELFSGEVIDTTATQLANGIPITMTHLDGRAYLISKKRPVQAADS